jgi:catechol 2,3-dioxygenase-like lactoylglutathione lyase family enzyme
VVHDSQMIDHLGISCADLPRSAAFYDTVLGTLGHARLMDFGVAIGYGTDKPGFWLSVQPESGPASGPNREIHVAFSATSADAVRVFFAAAVDQGAEVLHEPRHWPEYHDHYYAAFVRDPDGNNVEVVCHAVAPAAGTVSPVHRGN